MATVPTSQPAAADTVHARPTKRLVARVITKDIQLEDAVLDLIDNSIDGARRTSGTHRTKLNGYFVHVDFSPEGFRIVDNCGGIPYELARDYAFRFGRLDDLSIEGEGDFIGNFGVGMKRALLKMGKEIVLKSITPTIRFDIVIDVVKWLADDVNWDFAFSNVVEEHAAVASCGTSIEVRALYSGVAERLGLMEFQATLNQLVRQKEILAILSGMEIRLNGEGIQAKQMTLLESNRIKPIFIQKAFGVAPKKVEMRLYAGISEPSNDEAGWYLICNNRVILKADRSAITGFGSQEAELSDRIPSYHYQYARFRGYVFFSSTAPSELPWNTTKTGVDAEHPIYLATKLDMLIAMRAVFNFLDDLDKEKEFDTTPLADYAAKAEARPLLKIKPAHSFSYPAAAVRSPQEKMLWIRYRRPKRQVDAVMERLEVSTPSSAGEETFDVYYTLQVEEE